MEHAAFEPPLSDDQLKELGRLVVNSGFVEFILAFHVGMLLGVGDLARVRLIHPLSTRRKLDILKAGLDKIPGKETRALVEEACKLADPAVRERNLLLHGIWGFEEDKPDGKPVVAATKETHGHRFAEDITKTADVLAIASRRLLDAIVVDKGEKPEEKRDRLVIDFA